MCQKSWIFMNVIHRSAVTRRQSRVTTSLKAFFIWMLHLLLSDNQTLLQHWQESMFWRNSSQDQILFVASTKIKCFSALFARCPISSSIIKEKEWMSQFFTTEFTHSSNLKESKLSSNKHIRLYSYLLWKHRNVKIILFFDNILWMTVGRPRPTNWFSYFLSICNEAISFKDSFSTLSCTLSTLI